MALKFEDMGVSVNPDNLIAYDSTDTDPVCSYAKVSSIDTNDNYKITIDTSSSIEGKYSTIDTNSEILFHVSSTKNTINDPIYLGNYCVASITAKNDNVLTLNKDVTTVIPRNQFGNYNVQIITFARFDNLSLDTGNSISPIEYSDHRGGILAIKVFGDLTLNGGYIDLTDKGIPTTDKSSYRSLTNQEKKGTLSTDLYSGWENSQTKDKFILNSGDGAVFIVVYGTLIIPSETSSRIGNPSYDGVSYCRGDSDTENSLYERPDNTTNIGGSTIFIGAKTIQGFDPKIISKYRTATSGEGQGICRCYIASNTKLPNDEGLYAYDNISDKNKVLSFGINGYGTGKDGDYTRTNTTISGFNKYARIISINDNNRQVLNINEQSSDGPEIAREKLVMIHANYKGNYEADNIETIMQNNGWFMFANILAVDDTQITLNKAIPENIDPINYNVQLIVCNQYSSITLSGDINFDMTYYENHTLSPLPEKTDLTVPPYGGIVVLVCNGDLNIRSARLKSSDYGWDELAYYEKGLKYIGNCQMNDRIPIGGGMGSIFILARTITMDDCTTIGNKQNGALPSENYVTDNFNLQSLTSSSHLSFGGIPYGRTNINKGGYFGDTDFSYYVGSNVDGINYGVGNYNSGSLQKSSKIGHGSLGSGNKYKWDSSYSDSYKACQGAHIFIIADTINNFKQSQISTGGAGFFMNNSAIRHGSCGYGGGGLNVRNGGGGGSGWAFIYCNNAPNQDTTYTVNY